MASLPVSGTREAVMSEELTRFWRSVARKFERVSSPGELLPQLPTTWEQHLHHPDKEEASLQEKERCPEAHHNHRHTTLEECDIRWSDGVRVVDGSLVGDVPTTYRVEGLLAHERPVMGTYVDPAITVGFCYHVRHANSTKLLFKGRALRLVSVGAGYGKRITFTGDSHNVNNNYFWSDTHPEGYGFGLCLVHEGDKFTLRDANNLPVATAEVLKIRGPQVEVDHSLRNSVTEKRAKVSLQCKVFFFGEVNKEQVLVVKGVAMAVRAKGSRAVASLKEIKECSVGGERGYTLVAGEDTSSLISVVSGDKIGDVPTKYSIKGLLPHEMPVIGTYVDPRILTGFKYRVRAADSKKPLFNGDAQVLLAIGRGYGKRLTFASNNLNNNGNYFWSDTNPEGYGFSIQAVSPGDKFRIMTSFGKELGHAQVFRADAPQMEESCLVSPEGHVTKRVRVTVTCDTTFHGEDDHTLIVTGTAIVVRRGRKATVQKLEDVALGSQMNVLFRHTSETILFFKE